MSNSLGKVPNGAPRGLLIYWMLHRIAQSPTSGYEILTEIDQKTGGAWRPGAGSIYPLLRKLVAKGYVEAEPSPTGRSDRKRYRVTSKGKERIQESRKLFKTIGNRFTQMRGIFLDLVGPEELAGYVVEGTRGQFELAKGVVESNLDRLPASDLRYMMREYSLLLEKQLDWASGFLEASSVASKGPQRRRTL